jgi:hypothetical protein
LLPSTVTNNNDMITTNCIDTDTDTDNIIASHEIISESVQIPSD